MPPLTLSNFHVMSISLVMVCSFNLDHLVLCPLFASVVVFRVVSCAFLLHMSLGSWSQFIDEVLVMGASVVFCAFSFPYGFSFGPVLITFFHSCHRQSCFVHFRSHMVRGPG